MTATEYVILVDEQDNEIGTAEKLSAHAKNLLHRAFSVFLFQSEDPTKLLLQQRALSKYHSPGLWTNTCCSHPRQGEDIIKAGERRLHEELGIAATLKHAGSFHYNAHFENGLSENEIDHVLVGSVAADVALMLHPEEIQRVRWVTLEEVRDELVASPALFTPWFAEALAIATRRLDGAQRNPGF